MGTSIFTGVTGLMVHQRRLDVIANNIANVNTTGFRGGRVIFQDLFSQTLEGASPPAGNFGGTNPLQVGLGVQIGSIDTDFGQGSLFSTGSSSDMAIQGNGFFILRGGSGNLYSRDGSFQLNANGALVDPATGFRVQGFQADNGVIDTNAEITDLTIPVGGSSIVQETTLATMIGNLNADTAVGDTVNRTIRVFDTLGTQRDIDLVFTKTANPNEWDFEAFSDDNDPPGSLFGGTPRQITFDNSGALTSSPQESISITFPAGDPSVPTSPFTFDLDLASVTQLASESDVTLRNQNGFPRGVLEAFNIGENGVINGVFTNGLTQTLGQIALANFANVGALERAGNNLFRETPGTGTPQVGAANTGGRGQVSGGVLEGSNVDLGTEFSNMIVTQRGFQANARTITVSDTLLQETVNLIR